MNDQYDEIDLRELFGVLWAGKTKVIAITAVFAIASVIHALSVPNQYKATELLAPAQQDSGGISRALGQLGGLASLAGVSIGGGGSTETQVAQEIMKSWSFIEGFIEDNNLAVGLSAAEGWDIESNELKINHNVYDVDSNRWLVQKPTSWALFNSFSSRVSLRPHGNSGLLSISIEHYSPYVAKEWLDLYVAAINKHMQFVMNQSRAVYVAGEASGPMRRHWRLSRHSRPSAPGYSRKFELPNRANWQPAPRCRPLRSASD